MPDTQGGACRSGFMPDTNRARIAKRSGVKPDLQCFAAGTAAAPGGAYQLRTVIASRSVLEVTSFQRVTRQGLLPPKLPSDSS